MVLVHLPFIAVNVVGEGDAPASVFEADTHEADSSKELCACFVLCVHLLLLVLLHLSAAVLNSEVMRVRTASGWRSAWPQKRRTRHPEALSALVMVWSRAELREILRCQYWRLSWGMRQCQRQPCQKQPSTKIATR